MKDCQYDFVAFAEKYWARVKSEVAFQEET